MCHRGLRMRFAPSCGLGLSQKKNFDITFCFTNFAESFSLHFTGLSGDGGDGIEVTGRDKRGERMKKSDSAAYYHVCTDGNALEWMFKDDADFIAGVNRIGICAFEACVQVIAFILMDNHVHFVLYGTMPQCKSFITRYKTLTGRWISSKYQIKEHLKHLPTRLILIESEEQLLDTIAYIDRNSIIAGLRYLPCDYPWGSARYLFRGTIEQKTACRHISEMSRMEVQDILKTWCTLPEEWSVNAVGMLEPEHSFLNVKLLENLFKSPIRYLFHLSKKLEGKIEMQEGAKAFIPDKELRKITEGMVNQYFGKESIKELDFNSRILLARKLRYNYASTPKQISRMVYLDSDVLNKFI